MNNSYSRNRLTIPPTATIQSILASEIFLQKALPPTYSTTQRYPRLNHNTQQYQYHPCPRVSSNNERPPPSYSHTFRYPVIHVHMSTTRVMHPRILQRPQKAIRTTSTYHFIKYRFCIGRISPSTIPMCHR